MQAVAHRIDAERRAAVRHTSEGEALAFLPKTESILSLTREIDAGNPIRKSPHGLLQLGLRATSRGPPNKCSRAAPMSPR
jgi:hypothetical protein